jgi:hypothetical protein
MYKKGNEVASDEVSQITQKIREIVWKDLTDLQLNFPHLLTDELINEVDDDLNENVLDDGHKPKREELDKAFNNTFTELQKLSNVDADSRDTNASRKVAYKLISIGVQMKTSFNEDEEERAHVALQQFAANLAVYALQLDKGGNAKTNEGTDDDEEIDSNDNGKQIRDIAQKWPIGMMQWIVPSPTLENTRKSLFLYHEEEDIERFD